MLTPSGRPHGRSRRPLRTASVSSSTARLNASMRTAAKPDRPALIGRRSLRSGRRDDPRQTATTSECRYRWLRVPATTFVITRSPSRSDSRDVCGIGGLNLETPMQMVSINAQRRSRPIAMASPSASSVRYFIAPARLTAASTTASSGSMHPICRPDGNRRRCFWRLCFWRLA